VLGRRRLVRAHMTGGQSFEGVLIHRSPDCYRLAMPKLLSEEDQTLPLDGEVELPRERVLFLQLLAKGA
jgi:hypothetical protein